MWFRGSISLIINQFLRVFSISGFLKVIHTLQTPPKRGVNQVPQKLTSSIAFFKSLQSGLPMNLINTPMPRVSCRNDENPEKKNFEKKIFLRFFFKFFFFSNFFFSGFSSFRQLTLGMGVFIRSMASPDCKDL